VVPALSFTSEYDDSHPIKGKDVYTRVDVKNMKTLFVNDISGDPFTLTYGGWYGIGSSGPIAGKPSTISHFKSSGKIDNLVNAVNSCVNTRIGQAVNVLIGNDFYLQYGGWTQDEAGIAGDLKGISVSTENTW